MHPCILMLNSVLILEVPVASGLAEPKSKKTPLCLDWNGSSSGHLLEEPECTSQAWGWGWGWFPWVLLLNYQCLAIRFHPAWQVAVEVKVFSRSFSKGLCKAPDHTD